MTARSSRETLESVRVTLQKLEQTTYPVSDAQDIAELKQILLNRMAELEALSAMEPTEVESAPFSSSDLSSLAVVTREDMAKEAVDTAPLERLD